MMQSIYTGKRERLDPVHWNTNYKPFYVLNRSKCQQEEKQTNGTQE
jgi:hypothetical protein